jgi:hypothetical protein
MVSVCVGLPAVRRAARLGDRRLGIWVSPLWFATVRD